MKKKNNITLEEIGKELPFAVPENYFNEFAQNFEAQVIVNKVSVHKLFRPWMYMAAMFVGILILGNIFYSVYQNNIKSKEDKYESYVLSQVDESSIVDYYVDKQPAKK
jgi:hypothetical protein